jgi:pantothenate kinase-related protein Tda10
MTDKREERLVLFTTTCYQSVDAWRAKLAIEMASKCMQRGIPMVVCDE